MIYFFILFCFQRLPRPQNQHVVPNWEGVGPRLGMSCPSLSSVEAEVDRVVRLPAVQTVAWLTSKATGSHLLDLVEIFNFNYF